MKYSEVDNQELELVIGRCRLCASDRTAMARLSRLISEIIEKYSAQNKLWLGADDRQEMFLEVWTQLPKLDMGRGKAFGFIWTVIRQRLSNHRRNEQRRFGPITFLNPDSVPDVAYGRIKKVD